MKKITKIIALFLAVSVLFSGCATLEMKTTIKNDGTVDTYNIQEFDKTAYDEMCIKNNPGLYTSPEDVEKALRANHASASVETGKETKVEVVTKEDGKPYYVITQSDTFKFVNEDDYGYSNSEGVYGFYDDYTTKDTVYITFDGDEFAYTIALMDSIDTGNEYDISKGKITYEVEFPSNIVASQGGKIDNANPKKITFDFPISGGKFTAFATTNPDVTIDKVKEHIKQITSEKDDDEKITKVNKPKIKSVKVKSVKKKKGTVSLKWSKVKGAKYEVQYSTNKKFKKKATKTKSTKKTSIKIKKLKAGKKYYFRVRAVKKDESGNAYYSKYSKKKALKIVKKSKKK